MPWHSVGILKKSLPLSFVVLVFLDDLQTGEILRQWVKNEANSIFREPGDLNNSQAIGKISEAVLDGRLVETLTFRASMTPVRSAGAGR